jgi:Uncharacterized conserved protein
MVNILIIGGYGYNDVGDEAQPHAILDNLYKELSGEVSIVMLSPKPSFTKKYHHQESEPDISFISKFKSISNIFPFITNNHLLVFDYYYIIFYSWLRTIFRLCLPIREEIKKIYERIEWADIVINSGGGNINSIMPNELRKRTCIHRIAKILHKKVFVSNQTIGPFYKNLDRRLAKKALNKVDLLTFRDQKTSIERCREIGIVNKKMFDAADDAMSLYAIKKDESLSLIKSDVKEAWFNLPATFIFGLNIKASLNSFKGQNRSCSLDNEVENLVKVSEYILEKFDSKILYISTDFCPGVDDREYLGKIRTKLNKKYLKRTAILEKEYTDYELKGIIGTLDFAFGVRYHFNVFALSQTIPSIGIASGDYQKTKLQGVFNLCKIPEFYINHDLEYVNIELVYPIIDRMVNEQDIIHQKLIKQVPILIENSKMAITETKKFYIDRRDNCQNYFNRWFKK